MFSEKIHLIDIFFISCILLGFTFLPLTPFNNFLIGFDSQVFITCSSLIQKGWIMYRDIFDHKGPFVYLYDLIGLNIWGIHGIWIMAILFHSISTYYYYKISHLITNSTWSSKITAVFIFFIQLLYGEDNTAELISMPFLTYSVYTMLTCLYKNKELKKKTVILLASFFAIVFFVKPNFAACTVFLAISIMVKIAIQGKWNLFHQYLICLILGFSLITIPIIAYFYYNNALYDFINTYFIFNFKYSSDTSTFSRLKSFITLFCTMPCSILIWGFTIGSIWYLIKSKKIKDLLFSFSWLLFTAFLNLGLSGFPYRHYILPLLPVSCIFIALFWQNKSKNAQVLGILFLCLNILYYIRARYSEFNYGKPYIKELNYLTNVTKNYTKENDVITLYNTRHPYLHVTSNRMPSSKYIYQYPPFRFAPKLKKEYFNDIQQKKPKLIITNEGNLGDIKHLLGEYEQIKDTHSELLLYKRKK